MTEGATQMEGGKMRLLTLNDLDGRTLAAKCLRELESQVTVDLGGDLTAGQKALLHHASGLSAILEDQLANWVIGAPLELNEYYSGLNVLRRLLMTIGLERIAKPVGGSPVLLGES